MLIDAERVLLEFQLSYERALANRTQRLAELEMLVGREVPRGKAEQPEKTPDKTGAKVKDGGRGPQVIEKK